MGAVTKAELEALVKRLQAKNVTLTKSLDQAKVKNKTLSKLLRDAKANVTGLEEAVAEGREREKATAEILSIISRSPTDVQPVFDAIVKSGNHLFEGIGVSLLLAFGDRTKVVASTLPQPLHLHRSA